MQQITIPSTFDLNSKKLCEILAEIEQMDKRHVNRVSIGYVHNEDLKINWPTFNYLPDHRVNIGVIDGPHSAIFVDGDDYTMEVLADKKPQEEKFQK